MSRPGDRNATRAMILCAGLGTRLRPLTDWLAKPMAPIGDAPAVEHVTRQLRRARLARLVVNVHHRPADLRAWAEAADAAVSDEPELLGTAGGLARAASLLGEGDVLVWNGDILSELDPNDLWGAHAASSALATLAVLRRRVGEGNVGLDEYGRVVRLRRERFGAEVAGADFVGVHVVGARLREELPVRGCLVGDVYLPALRRGAHLAAHVVTKPFVDVGSIAEYVRANRAWLARRGASSWVAPTARVDASIDGSLVGAHARVDAAALGCIVWPHACVVERVENAIVTPCGAVPFPADPTR